ncbi:MAG: hypothetical protein JWM85_802 [Acidimicrobiaceae bacterium]|nr:hypothetical protein [Acidimicrobiaceae bacterium]
MLALREEGLTFAAIARDTGIGKASDAHRALLREVRAQPEGERKLLVGRELRRLDVLEQRIRIRDAEAPEKMTQRVEVVEKMRRLLAGAE